MDSMEQGLDPRVNNPGDPSGPWHQRFNYPSLWLYIMRALGLHERDSARVGLILITGFLFGLWWITADIPVRTSWYYTLIFFSPATMFIIERCNHDLVIFFLLGLALLAQRSAVVGMAIVFLAFMLKLFPLAGLLLLLRETRTRALRLTGLMLLGAAIYILATFDDLLVISRTTERGADTAYGYNVLWHYLRLQRSPWETPVRAIAYLLVTLSLGAAWWFHRNPVVARSDDRPTRQMDGYRLGAGVYAGTFLLGNSWDYRLVFFFFAVPQLFIWLRKNHARCWIALVQLIAFAVASWAMLLTFWISHSETTFIVARGLEELGKWTLFASSLWLLAETLPHWARDLLGFRFRTQTGSAAAPLAPR